MKKRIFILCIAIISCLFLFCSCEEERDKTYTSITSSVEIEGVEKAQSVVITVKHNESGEKFKITLYPEKEKTIELEPGTYFISNVRTNTKQITVSLSEKYFTISKSNRNISLTVAKENKMSGVTWFFYNNSFYLLCLVGCSVFLGVNKYIKEKKMNMR